MKFKLQTFAGIDVGRKSQDYLISCWIYTLAWWIVISFTTKDPNFHRTEMIPVGNKSVQTISRVSRKHSVCNVIVSIWIFKIFQNWAAMRRNVRKIIIVYFWAQVKYAHDVHRISYNASFEPLILCASGVNSLCAKTRITYAPWYNCIVYARWVYFFYVMLWSRLWRQSQAVV